MRNNFLIAWRLLRGTNLVLLAVSLSLVLVNASIDLPLYSIIAVFVGTTSIAGAGNLLNDILDQDIDQINQAEKRLVGVWIGESLVWRGYYALNIGALLLAIGTGIMGLVVSYGLSIVLLYVYSRYWKCSAWWGNWVVAFLCALSFLQLLVLAPAQWTFYWCWVVVIYATFAFLTNWWRELIKDIEDELGDRQMGCQTLVVQRGMAYGLKIAHYICNALLLWLVLIIGLLWQWAPFGACCYAVGVLLPTTIYLKIRLQQVETTVQVQQFSQLLKGYMLLGLLGFVFL